MRFAADTERRDEYEKAEKRLGWEIVDALEGPHSRYVLSATYGGL